MGPFGSNIKTDNFRSSGVPVIRGVNISKGRFNPEEFVFISEEKADSLKSANVFADDIIFTHRGTLGQVGIVPKNGTYKRYVISQSQMKLTCDKNKANPLFVYYFFRSPQGQHALLSNTSTTGVPAIGQPLSSLKRIKLYLPPLVEQDYIANVLNNFDDKIELNERITNTSRMLCQVLFKKWFVDFEFPDKNGNPYKSSGGKMKHSELGSIPIQWHVSLIGNEYQIGGGSTPKTSTREFWHDGKINWATPKDMSLLDSDILFDTKRKITKAGLKSISSMLYPRGTLLLSSRAPIGHLCISDSEVAINQGIIAIMPNSFLSNYYLLNWCKRNMGVIKNMANGTTFLEISKSVFKVIKIIVPSRDVVEKYDLFADMCHSKMILDMKQNDILKHIRDVVLPDLISGRICVPRQA
jgi:type I restriction enzyme S subunit